MNFLGEQIKKYRKETSLSQIDLAKMVGVSRQTISHWEDGESLPNINQSILLAKSLNVTLDDLIKKGCDKNVYKKSN